MVRVLTREESHARRMHRKTNQPYPAAAAISPVTDAEPGTHPWLGRPADAAERARVIAAAIEYLPVYASADKTSPVTQLSDAERPLIRLLDWLDGFPGDSYQDRWLAADTDARPRQWCPEMTWARAAARGPAARPAR